MTAISKVKETLAVLKGVEASLETYSLQESDKEAKEIYREAYKEIHEIKCDLEKRIGFMEYEEPQYKGK